MLSTPDRTARFGSKAFPREARFKYYIVKPPYLVILPTGSPDLLQLQSVPFLTVVLNKVLFYTISVQKNSIQNDNNWLGGKLHRLSLNNLIWKYIELDLIDFQITKI